MVVDISCTQEKIASQRNTQMKVEMTTNCVDSAKLCHDCSSFSGTEPQRKNAKNPAMSSKHHKNTNTKNYSLNGLVNAESPHPHDIHHVSHKTSERADDTSLDSNQTNKSCNDIKTHIYDSYNNSDLNDTDVSKISDTLYENLRHDRKNTQPGNDGNSRSCSENGFVSHSSINEIHSSNKQISGSFKEVSIVAHDLDRGQFSSTNSDQKASAPDTEEVSLVHPRKPYPPYTNEVSNMPTLNRQEHTIRTANNSKGISNTSPILSRNPSLDNIPMNLPTTSNLEVIPRHGPPLTKELCMPLSNIQFLKQNLNCTLTKPPPMIPTIPPPCFTDFANGVVLPPSLGVTLPVPGYVYGVPQNTTCYFQQSQPLSVAHQFGFQSNQQNSIVLSCDSNSHSSYSSETSTSPHPSPSLFMTYPTSPPTTVSMPAPLSPTASMELVWHGEFDRLFSQYLPHAWYLLPTFYPPTERWQVFKDSAKVRFSCQCGHGWTSMKGRVIFWFHLNYAANSGYVLFKLYGQECIKCKSGNYEHAMWYPEEVIKVIGNVYNRVGQLHYGFVRPPLRIDRRQGKPRNQHNASLCQACKEGLCREEWAFS